MTIIIGVVNQKGGCAKTTSTMQIGGELAVRGFRVGIIDMDKQGTATTWSGQADEDSPFPATVFSLAAVGSKIFSEIKKHAPNYDFILIDCPPAIESEIPWNVLLCADLAIIPVMPAMDNVWASKEAKNLAVAAKQRNENLLIRLLPSRVPRGNAYQLCLNQMRNDPDCPMYKNHLSDKIAYAESQILGTCITSYAPKSTAAKEVRAVVDEILADLAKEK